MTIIKLLVVVGVVMLVGCSSVVSPSKKSTDSVLLAQALSGQSLLGRPFSHAELPDIDLFALTPEIKAFADSVIDKSALSAQKAEALHVALLKPVAAGGRGITYSAYMTNTGVDAFEQRQANCLSYTLLYVAMARYVGLNAQVNEVFLPPTWDIRSSDDTYLFMRHVNAKVILSKRKLSWIRAVNTADIGDIVVDLEMRRYRSTYEQKMISNEMVAAQFYSNRGMELAAAGDKQNSFLNLRKALALVSDASYIWSNLGSVYRRNGFPREAESLYLKGLTINPDDLTIMHNLAGVYKELGEQARYEELRKKVRAHRNANPYFIYKLAQDAQQKGDYERARKLIQKAIKKQQDEPLFYRFAIIVYERLGDAETAEKMRQKMLKAEK